MTDFDPAAHRMVPQQRWFEDFVLGERFVIPSRTMTSAVFAAFQTASGDTHPVHYDVEYCRARGMPHLLAHGFQTLVHTAPGAGLFPYLVEESLVGFLEQSSRFLKPVYADDTIYPALEVTELVPGRTTGMVTLRTTVYNQRRELVLEGCRNFCSSAGRRRRNWRYSIPRAHDRARIDNPTPTTIRTIIARVGRTVLRQVDVAEFDGDIQHRAERDGRYGQDRPGRPSRTLIKRKAEP